MRTDLPKSAHILPLRPHSATWGQRTAYFEAVERIDALFDIEREINGKTPSQRVTDRTMPGNTCRYAFGRI